MTLLNKGSFIGLGVGAIFAMVMSVVYTEFIPSYATLLSFGTGMILGSIGFIVGTEIGDSN